MNFARKLNIDSLLMTVFQYNNGFSALFPLDLDEINLKYSNTTYKMAGYQIFLDLFVTWRSHETGNKTAEKVLMPAKAIISEFLWHSYIYITCNTYVAISSVLSYQIPLFHVSSAAFLS